MVLACVKVVIQSMCISCPFRGPRSLCILYLCGLETEAEIAESSVKNTDATDQGRARDGQGAVGVSEGFLEFLSECCCPARL